ncbi:MAG: translocation/assembly module TamB domain-containing protein [Bacteroidales bacterium]|jgi:hypothetical protein|nr:translocation/assembly module TamB domain-containing protein [Bacteroidales bacterium]
MKHLRHILRIIAKTIAILLAFVALCYALSLLPAVQQRATRFVSRQLSTVLGLNVSIDAIRISSYNTISLIDAHITNSEHDTIIQAKKIAAKLHVIDFKDLQVELSAIKLKQATIRAVKEQDSVWNFDAMLVKLFSDTTESKGWKVAIEDISVEDSKLILINRTAPHSTEAGIDFNNLKISDFNCDVTALRMPPDGGVALQINSMSGVEQSGFELKQLQTSVVLTSSHIDLQNLHLQTNNSDIVLTQLLFTYKNFGSFSDFINQVTLSALIQASTVKFSDIAYFTSALQNVPYEISLQGSVQGTIADFKARNMTITTGTMSKFMGDVECSGLPAIAETYLYVKATALETSYHDIANFRIPPFDSEQFVDVPTLVQKLTNIRYVGEFSGFFTDFVAYGTWETNLGNFKTDISLSQKEGRRVEYAGKIQTSSFDVGTLLGAQPTLRRVALEINTSGTVRNAAYIDGALDGTVQSIDFNDYTYSNIILNGTYTNTKYDGNVVVNDPNVRMDFSGLLDFTDTLPKFQFQTTVEHANLYPLNFHSSDSVAQISLSAQVNSLGIELDNLNGSITVNNFIYKGSAGVYSTRYANVQFANFQKNRSMQINSDLLDMTLQGRGNYSEVPAYLYDFLRTHIPSLPDYFKKTRKTYSPQFTASLTVKNLDNLLQVALPELSVAAQSTVALSFDDSQKQFSLQANFPSLAYSSVELHDIVIRNKGDEQDITTSVRASYDSLTQMFFTNKIERDSAFSQLWWQNKNTVQMKGKIVVNGSFGTSLRAFPPTIDLDVQPGRFVVADSLWNIGKSRISIHESTITVENLSLSKGNQLITVNGEISQDPQKRITITLDNFNTNNISQILQNANVQFEGPISGTIEARDLYNRRRMYLNIQSPELWFNGHLLGALEARSRLLPNQNNAVAMNFSLAQNGAGITVKGTYTPQTSVSDFAVVLNNIDLQMFSGFLDGILDNMKGLLNGTLHVQGDIQKPQFDGNLNISNSSFRVNYTKVPYALHCDITVKGTQFTFANATLTDTLGNIGSLQGFIDLQTLANPRYSIDIRTQKLLLADIKENQNDVFYGRIVYKGNVGIDGNLNGMKITGVGETLATSECNIPLQSSELTQQNFITFVDSAKLANPTPIAAQPTFTPEMNLNLRVTPLTTVRIIFDRRVGDIIRVQGTSNMQLVLNKQGDFRMYGEYLISEGDYLFTLRNLINKLFVIQNGGRLVFNGDPLQAQINLVARYSLKASPKAIMDAMEGDNFSRRIPVICEINLQNNLMQPDITYNIIVESSSQVQDVINTMSTEEKNIQFLSLLLMNSFFASTSPNQALNASASFEVLSNQLNNILSQMNLPVDVGVNFRPGDTYSGTTSEFELELSRALFNNRVLVNVQSGFGGTTSDMEATNPGSEFAGDVSVELKLNEQGTFRIKGFSRTNNDPMKDTRDNTQGISLFYTKEFNTWTDFFTRRKHRRARNTAEPHKVEISEPKEEAEHEEQKNESEQAHN